MSDRAVFTIAGGKRSYFKMALNLARSFERWHPTGDPQFFIVTDLDVSLPKDLQRARLLRPGGRLLPKGFSAKLQLDLLQPAQKALFLDADCLVMGSLDPLFDAFRGKPVGVFGTISTSGECFGDIEHIRESLKIPWMPLFNGGVYYLEQGDASRSIFNYARRLEPNYDEIGFVRLRGQPNEEVLIGAALADHDIVPVPNDGQYYADFQWWPVVKQFDLGTGTCLMYNPPVGDPRHQAYFPARWATPAIVHFLGYNVNSIRYRRSALALLLWGKGVPAGSAIARACFIHLELLGIFKNILRPLYHMFFRHRAVKHDRNRYMVDPRQ